RLGSHWSSRHTKLLVDWSWCVLDCAQDRGPCRNLSVDRGGSLRDGGNCLFIEVPPTVMTTPATGDGADMPGDRSCRPVQGTGDHLQVAVPITRGAVSCPHCHLCGASVSD